MKRLVWLGVFGGLVAGGCDGGGGVREDQSNESEVTPAARTVGIEEQRLTAERELVRGVVENYAAMVYAGYADALAAARQMQDSLRVLVEEPSEESLAAARDAWKSARVPYLQTEVFRFYGGPIDNEADGLDGLMNAWPLDAAYVDYVADNPDAGVVNQTELYPEITKAMLAELNGSDGGAIVSTGYHVIEFLLWGEDSRADGPGDRRFGDYVVGEGRNAERRGVYLLTAGELLVDHLQALVNAWDPEINGNYRSEFLAESETESLRRIFTGLGMLSGYEVSGERLAVAYETKEEADERSRFSDTTHVDILENVRGMRNVYFGRWVRSDGAVVEGPGLGDLVGTADPELAARLREQLDVSLTLAEALPVPFDQGIQGADDAPGRQSVAGLIASLRDVAVTVVAAGALFGLEVPVQK